MASVLLIESEAPLVRLMAWFLLEAGFEVSKVADGQLAVDHCRAAAPHVIVFNTGLADEDKKRCIEQLRQLAPASGILDVSGHTWPQGPGETGADRYLQMPFHADSFIEAVTELVHR